MSFAGGNNKRGLFRTASRVFAVCICLVFVMPTYLPSSRGASPGPIQAADINGVDINSILTHYPRTEALVKATVVNASYFWSDSSWGRSVYTKATLNVSEVQWGAAPRTMSVVEEGGIMDGYVLQAGDNPIILTGDVLQARLEKTPVELHLGTDYMIRSTSHVLSRSNTQYSSLALESPKAAAASTPVFYPGYGYSFDGSLFWTGDHFPITYYISLKNAPAYPPSTDIIPAIRAAFQSWEDDTASVFDVTYGGNDNRLVKDVYDGLNVVCWNPIDGVGGDIAYTYILRDLATGHILSADICFDTAEQWCVGYGVGMYDIQAVCAHEAGHFVGLRDLFDTYWNDPSMTMYKYHNMNDISKRSLEWGDIAGVRYLYGGQVQVGSMGSYQAGADISIGQIDRTGTNDMLFAWVDDPSGANYIYWKVGFNINANTGQVGSWSAQYSWGTGIGTYTSGLGVGLFDINGNGIVDAIFAWCDNPSGQDSIKYAIAWDLSTYGTASSWSSVKVIPSDGIGNTNDGMDIDIANVVGTSRPDLIVAWVDHPTSGNDYVRWKIGKDLDTAGNVASGWTAWTSFSTNVAVGRVQGCGVGVADFDMNGVSDVIFSVMEVGTGPGVPVTNKMTYDVGWSVGSNGLPTSWTGWRNGPVGWVGSSTDGLGMDCAQFDSYASEEIVLFWIDDPSGVNTCYYRVEWEGRLGGQLV